MPSPRRSHHKGRISKSDAKMRIRCSLDMSDRLSAKSNILPGPSKSQKTFRIKNFSHDFGLCYGDFKLFAHCNHGSYFQNFFQKR